MEKLTPTEAKMVIEYLAAQAAEDYPATGTFEGYEHHLWLTRMHASVAIDRRIHDGDWDMLVVNFIDLQSFDRDPEAYLYQHGATSESINTEATQDKMRGILEDLVSWAIDLAYDNSGA